MLLVVWLASVCLYTGDMQRWKGLLIVVLGEYIVAHTCCQMTYRQAEYRELKAFTRPSSSRTLGRKGNTLA